MTNKQPQKRREIRYIKQRTKADCAVACAAMVSGRTYDDVIKVANFSDMIGLATQEVCNFLSIQHIPHRYMCSVEGLTELDSQNGGARFGITQRMLRDQIAGKVAVMTFHSFSHSGYHALVWNRDHIVDPASRSHRHLEKRDAILEVVILED